MAIFSIAEGREKITELAKRNTPHPAHDAQVKALRFWSSIVSGDNQEEIIVSFKPRENEDQKKQRVKITNTPTPKAAARAVLNLDYLENEEDIQEDVSYSPASTDKLKILNDRAEKFNGGRSLNRYIIDEFKREIQRDANAFLVVLFDGIRDQNGAFVEKPYPRPEKIPCDQVFDLGIDNGDYTWLCRKQVFTKEVMIDGTTKPIEWQKFTLYMTDWVIELQQVNQANPITGDYTLIPVLQSDQAKGAEPNVFALIEYPIQSGETPFMPFGFDRSWNKEGYDVILKPAESDFRDLVNRASEYALSLALHTFLKEFIYAKNCKNSSIDHGFCDNGKMSVSKETCPSCKGSGKELITTSQDTIVMSLPETKDEFFPLSDLIYYPTLPFEIVTHQKMEVETIPDSIEVALWGVNTREKPTGQMTATEIVNRYQQAQTKLSRAGKHVNYMWAKCMRLTAAYAEIGEGLMLARKYPDRFQMETLPELIALLKEAKDGGAPLDTIRDLDRRILRMQNSGKDKEVVSWYEATENWRPWKSKTETQIAGILMTLPDDEFYKVLWTYFDEIFGEIKAETPDFPKMPFLGNNSQKSVLTLKVAQFQALANVPIVSAADAMGAVPETGAKQNVALQVQQLALGRQRAFEAGDTALAASIGAKINDLLQKI